MFDVIVNYIKDFNVILKDFSKIDSLVGVVKYESYKISETATVMLSQMGKMISTNEMTVKISEILGFKGRTNSENNMSATINSIESFKDVVCSSEISMEQKIASLESLNGKMNNVSKIEAEPLFAYFRKLIEFDNKALYELDNLTLEEMDHVLTLMNGLVVKVKNE